MTSREEDDDQLQQPYVPSTKQQEKTTPTILDSRLASKETHRWHKTSNRAKVNSSNAKLLALAATLAATIWLRRHIYTPFLTWRYTLTPERTTSTTKVLEVFQVHAPVEAFRRNPSNDGIDNSQPFYQDCTVLLMEHSFGFSYGKPFVGNYVPPKCKFNRVTMNFTVTSKGRQFDRLAIMYFSDTEIWRTSTAEPTINGIRWEYVKDVTSYMYFWETPQKIVFDLGNLVNEIYTGSFNTTLIATFSLVPETVDHADLIIPISARKGSESKASLFTLPEQKAINIIDFPRNVQRAVFSVSACGQAAEEFWWGNVLQSDVDTFKDETGTLYGLSPFREVQVLIDGQLGGVQWPFPIIFTGGVVPGLWRPIVGIDTFDLREHEIDITPWLPILCDGNEHSFEIRVVGIQDDARGSGTLTKTVGNSWYVTGKIFLWLDEDSDAVTTGTAPSLLLPEPVISLASKTTQSKTGANDTLAYTTNVTRTLSVSSLITTQSGTRLVSWAQNLSVVNSGLFINGGSIQATIHTTTGFDQSTGPAFYTARYTYPLWANTSFVVSPSGNITLDAILQQGLYLNVQGASVFPLSFSDSSTISTNLNGNAHYFACPRSKVSTGYGSTNQTFSFIETTPDGEGRETYHRKVEAINGTLARDRETLNSVEEEKVDSSVRVEPVVAEDGSVVSPRRAMGRGPGEVRVVLVQSGDQNVEKNDGEDG